MLHFDLNIQSFCRSTTKTKTWLLAASSSYAGQLFLVEFHASLIRNAIAESTDCAETVTGADSAAATATATVLREIERTLGRTMSMTDKKVSNRIRFPISKNKTYSLRRTRHGNPNAIFTVLHIFTYLNETCLSFVSGSRWSSRLHRSEGEGPGWGLAKNARMHPDSVNLWCLKQVVRQCSHRSARREVRHTEWACWRSERGVLLERSEYRHANCRQR